MAEVVRKFGAAQTEFPIVQPVGVGNQELQRLGNDLNTLGEQIQRTANSRYLLQANTQIKREVTRIEQEHQGDPARMQKALGAFKKGFFSKFAHPDAKQRAMFLYDVEAQPALNRAFKAKQERLDNELGVQAILNIDASQSSMQDIAADLLDKDEEVSLAAGEKMQAQMFDMNATLGITKGDGTPLFTPQQRTAKILAARDGMVKKAASTFIQNSSDKLAAFHQWQQGDLTIPLPDAKGGVQRVKLRDVLSSQARVKIDREMMQIIKDDISLQNMIEKAEEDAKQKKSDEIESKLMVQAQDGALKLQDVEAMKSQLMPETFIDLRKLALSDEPVGRGEVYYDLKARALQGEDVIDQAKNARLNLKHLDNKQSLDIINTVQKGTRNPVHAGEKFLVDNLQGLNQDLNPFERASLANALKDYQLRIQQFREQEKRDPNLSEAFQLAEDILPEWQVINSKELTINLPKPKFMFAEEKGSIRNLTPERLQEIETDTDNFFFDKHGGDITKAAQDDEYVRELKKIDAFRRAIQLTGERKERRKKVLEKKKGSQ